MVFSLFKCVCRWGAGYVCVSKLVYEHALLCACVCMCLFSYSMYSSHVRYTVYCEPDRWVLHGCDQQRLEPCLPDCQYKPNKYLETCRVQLWSEVNTWLCWLKHILNRCVDQIQGQIAAQSSASFFFKSAVAAVVLKTLEQIY